MATVFKTPHSPSRRSKVRVVGHRPTASLLAAIEAVKAGRITEYESVADVQRAIEAKKAQRRGA